ncbi:MAG TPA: hypothetical protein VI980_06205 [Acidimicrobiia bacterium]|nr:hypothetical protein [Acidimicrobiia bacterium]
MSGFAGVLLRPSIITMSLLEHQLDGLSDSMIGFALPWRLMLYAAHVNMDQ